MSMDVKPPVPSWRSVPDWQMQHMSVALLIGGATGLDKTVLARANGAYLCQN